MEIERFTQPVEVNISQRNKSSNKDNIPTFQRPTSSENDIIPEEIEETLLLSILLILMNNFFSLKNLI
jgi:hypothetical protein